MTAQKHTLPVFSDNSLDYISLVASINVMLAHSCSYILAGGNGGKLSSWWLIAPGPAVTALFAISGFLACASFARTQNTVRYYLNRILRIYPPLITAILIPSLIFYFHDGGISFSGWFTSLMRGIIFAGNGYVPDGALGNGSLWSVFVQLQFFILTPLIYRLGKRLKGVHFIILTALAVILNIAAPLIQIYLGETVYKLYSYSCAGYIYMYLIGVYCCLHYDKIMPYLTKLCPVGIILFILSHYVLRLDTVMNFNYINPVSGILASLCAIACGYALGKHRIKYDISFGIFLWHMPVIDLLHYIIGMPYSWKTLLLTWFVSAVFAFISHILIEKPFFRLSRLLKKADA